MDWKTGLPCEHDSLFAKLKGTDRFKPGMFLKSSREMLVTIDHKGKRFTDTARTYDGKWNNDYLRLHNDAKVVAYADFPDPYDQRE